MDLAQTIRKLRKEREQLDQIIVALEELRVREAALAALPPKIGKRRGRKSMGETEREEVSRRMKRYWAKRREGAGRQNQ